MPSICSLLGLFIVFQQACIMSFKTPSQLAGESSGFALAHSCECLTTYSWRKFWVGHYVDFQPSIPKQFIIAQVNISNEYFKHTYSSFSPSTFSFYESFESTYFYLPPLYSLSSYSFLLACLFLSLLDLAIHPEIWMAVAAATLYYSSMEKVCYSEWSSFQLSFSFSDMDVMIFFLIKTFSVFFYLILSENQ